MFESCWAHHLTSSGGLPAMLRDHAPRRLRRRGSKCESCWAHQPSLTPCKSPAFELRLASQLS